jgi:hypothetical protein
MDLTAAHIGFVIAAYAISAIVLLGIGVWITKGGHNPPDSEP